MHFTIEIEDEYLDTLDSLSELVFDQPVSSPEEALEVAIFAHLQFQRTHGEKATVSL